MIKKTQIIIIALFWILGTVIITGIGIFNINNLKYFIDSNNESINVSAENNIDNNFKISIENKIENIKILTISSIAGYTIFSIVIGFVVDKKNKTQIDNLVKKFGKEYDEKTLKNNYLIEKEKNKEENEFVNAFRLITTEINEELTNVKEEKRQIENILLHMSDGVIAFNLEGNIIYINPAATTLLGLDSSDNNFDKIFRKLDIEINLEKLIYLEELTSFEQKINLENKYFTVSFKPFKDRNEKNAGIIVLIQDITEHVRLDNMRKEFVADVSHELKTPITSIMGYADTLLEGDYDKEVQEKFLNVIATEARRMAKLVTDLLTLSRHDSNKIKNEKQEFDLGELVKKCQEKLQIEIEKKHHNVECFVTANVPPIVADKYGIERVVLNILSNSIKYTEPNGNIKIYVGFVYNDAYIKIIDNGIGIPEEDLSRIFERFYRVDKARTRQMGGTGLGLSIAKEILDRNKGSIDIKSEVGKGTEVVIRIQANKQNNLEKE